MVNSFSTHGGNFQHLIWPWDTVSNSSKNDILRTSELCLWLDASKATVSRMVNGKIPGLAPLPCLRLGRSMRFRREAIENWLRENETCKAHSSK